MKVNVFITRKIPKEGFKSLVEKGYNLKFYRDNIISRKELLREARAADALCTMVTDKIDKEIILANPGLKIIANYAVGFDNIDLKSASERRLPVTNTPDVLTQSTAEHTIALMLSLARDIPEADRFTKSGKFVGWSPNIFLGSELKGKTLGIIGMGRIGKAVARIASEGLGMKILYFNKKEYSEVEKNGIKLASLDKLLSNSDFISIHVSLNQSTMHLMDTEKLSLMKKGSYLINMSRGQVIDEKALVKALKMKKISGAALDVFEKEPKLSPGLNRLKNVILTPHIGSATLEARKLMAETISKNVVAAINGEIPPNVVNKKIYGR